MKHTEGEWKIDKDYSTIIVTDTKNNGQFLICETKWSSRLTKEEMEANAKFIVRACNNHYKLLEACRLAHECIVTRAGVRTNVSEKDRLQDRIIIDKSIKLLEQAIAKKKDSQ